jgi:hypothetical protein
MYTTYLADHQKHKYSKNKGRFIEMTTTREVARTHSNKRCDGGLLQD